MQRQEMQMDETAASPGYAPPVYTSPAPPASQTRVTPEELAQALAAVEARRERSSSEAADTISLGEAISQLGLNVDPEELRGEIEARRASATMAVRHKRRNYANWALIPLGAFLPLSLVLFLLRSSSVQTATPATVTQPAMEIAAASPYAPLSTIEDDHPVRCNFITLMDIATGGEWSNVRVDTRSGAADSKLWTIVKHKGEIVVRCWADENAAFKAANGQAAKVFSAQNVDGVSVNREQVDIPGTRFRGSWPYSTESKASPVRVDADTVVTSVLLPPESRGPSPR